MSAYITGLTFPGQKIKPSFDGMVNAAELSDGSLAGCTCYYNGDEITVSKGILIACGRLIRLDYNIARSISTGDGQYAFLVLTVDTSNEEPEIDLNVVRSSTYNFPELTKNNINNEDGVYQTVLCLVDTSQSGDAAIRWTLGAAHARARAYSMTIPTSAWSNISGSTWSAGLFASGVLASTVVSMGYDPDSEDYPNNRENCRDLDVRLHAQADGRIVVRATSASRPSVAVRINLKLE